MECTQAQRRVASMWDRWQTHQKPLSQKLERKNEIQICLQIRAKRQTHACSECPIREPILAKIQFCLYTWVSVNTFYWCALLQWYSVLFILFRFCLFVSILSLLLTLLLLYMSLDERVALSFNLCILVLILDFRIFRLKLKFQ